MSFSFGFNSKIANNFEMQNRENSQNNDILPSVVTKTNNLLGNIIDDYDGKPLMPLMAYSVVFLDTRGSHQAVTVNLNVTPNLNIEVLKKQIASAVGKKVSELNFYKCNEIATKTLDIYSNQPFTAYSYKYHSFPNNGLVKDLNLNTKQTVRFAVDML